MCSQDVGAKNSTIFIPSNPGHVGDLSAEVMLAIFLCVLVTAPTLSLNVLLWRKSKDLQVQMMLYLRLETETPSMQMRNGFLQGMAGRQEMKRE